MNNPAQAQVGAITHRVRAAIAGIALLAAALLLPGLAIAQTFSVIYNFTGGTDGASPYSGVTIDSAGNLYGTTVLGGAYSSGAVYKLATSGSAWTLNSLYSFQSSFNNDGALPYARVIFGPDGALYGTTIVGGNGNMDCQIIAIYPGCGTVFRLAPSIKVCLAGPGKCPWTETIIHSFAGIPDGALPTSEVSFGPHGDMYGTTYTGGYQGGCYDTYGCGTAYKFSRTGILWTETATYSFPGGSNSVGQPYAGLLVDSLDNLYGTTACCAHYSENGTVFQLVPAGSTWTPNSLYTLSEPADGGYPLGTLIADSLGNLYGSTSNSGPNQAGTVFQLTPGGTLNVLASFAGAGNQDCGPQAALVMDSVGNLYGTTNCSGANGQGSVFELKKSAGWQYIPLHDFAGGANDGANPMSNLVFDAYGNIYGSASNGGTFGAGVIFEIMP